jgi:hypothetical protein
MPPVVSRIAQPPSEAARRGRCRPRPIEEPLTPTRDNLKWSYLVCVMAGGPVSGGYTAPKRKEDQGSGRPTIEPPPPHTHTHVCGVV